jgi:hypothetical protein
MSSGATISSSTIAAAARLELAVVGNDIELGNSGTVARRRVMESTSNIPRQRGPATEPPLGSPAALPQVC